MSKIQELGEFGLIHRLSSRLKFRSANTILGIGDDCAVYRVKSGTHEVISTDALVEDIHFSLSTTTPEALGRKALAVSLSDIAAMGGTPKRILVTLGIPKKISVSFLENFTQDLTRYVISLRWNLLAEIRSLPLNAFL